jgi:predicted TPR repeat methyltransferase
MARLVRGRDLTAMHDVRGSDLAALVAAGNAQLAAGRFTEAGALYAEARALDPDNPEVLHALGLIAWRGGALTLADELIAAAIAHDPAQAAYHDHHGLVLAALGRVAAAEAAHRRALALAPNLAAAHNNLAILLRAGGRAPEALAAVDRALTLDVGRPAFHLNRGEILAGLGQSREAAESFAAAIRLRPDYGDAFFALGQLWQRTGNHDGARFALRSYLTLDPADRHGAQALLALIDPAAMPAGFSPAYIRNLFDGYAGRFDAHLTGELRYRAPEILRDAIARSDPVARARDVLDLGCGTGLAGVAFKPLARRLVGIDLSPAMIEHARARAIYDALHVDDVVAALRQMPGAFDLIVAADVFIYLGDLAPVLTAMQASLRADGLAAFTLETASGQPYRLTPSRRFAHDPAHVVALARAAGFALVLQDPVTLRVEAGVAVAGAAFVLRRP